jgi:lipid II:glycine glycyltransferase (peptidoglycan interpeptide bridge formation enzyme)
LLLDLRRPLETLRADLKPHWRRSLKTADKNGLEIIEGSGDQLFELFIGIYREMVARKSFAEPNDIQEFRSIQKRLPEPWKMKIMLCKSGGQVCAGLVCSAIGDTAVYLFGATSDAGLKSMGSYLLHWKLIESLQKNGLATYDLNGIDPLMNPGTYKFKADLCGNSGKDLFFPGRFESCTSVLSYSCIAWGERLNALRRRLKEDSASRTQRARAYGPAYPGAAHAPNE